MKKTLKRLFASLLVVVMLLTVAPMSGVADVFDFTTKSSALASSGQCGDMVYYTFDEKTGLLTITGYGKMYDYHNNSHHYYYCDSPFFDNSSIKTVIIEYGVTSIGNYAFRGCTDLTSITIPDSVKSIGELAFNYCTGLKELTIGNSVESIGNSAFYVCSGLTSIVVDKDNKVYDSRDNCNAIIETSTNKLIQGCKNTVVPNGVTSIGKYAFYGCTGITSITIPDSVTSIGDHAFLYCTGLKKVTIGKSVTSLGYSAFENCKSLEEINLPEKLNYIGMWAFSDCISLKTVKIPDTVTEIAYGAFRNCKSIKELSLPCSAKIGDSDQTFLNCTNIEKITITKGSGIMQNYNGYISDSTEISYYEYTPWHISRNSIKEIVIEDGVTSIGSNAFYNCTGLTSITIPDSVTSIGDDAFYGCSNLTNINITDIAKWCNVSLGDGYANPLYYAHNLYLNDEPVTDLVIPNGVTSIGNYAFYGCIGLTSITISDSVTSIGSYAFRGGDDLISIVVDKDNKVYDSRDNCNAIIETSTNKLIKGCNNTVIPNNVTAIGGYAFDGCTGLTSITIPDGVTSIGGYAFRDCTGLTSVTIPDGVKSIGSSAFYYCIGLKSIVIPNSVESIGWGAFYNCNSLTDVYYAGSIDDFVQISIGNGNGCLIKAKIHFNCPPTSHPHSYNKVVTKPTCTTKGYTTYTCKCGDTYTADYVNALNHDFGEWKVTTPATCTSKGVETKYCSRCTETETREIEQLNHSYNKVVTKPTCTTQGYTTYTCKCGDTYTEDYVNALGHNFGEWKVTTPATTISTGVQTRYCSRCTATETKAIPMLTPEEPISATISVEVQEPVLFGMDARVNVTVSGSPSQVRFEFDGTTKSVYRDESIIEKFDDYEVWHVSLHVFKKSLEYKVHAKYGTVWSDNYAFFTLECETISAAVTKPAPMGGMAEVKVTVSNSPITIRFEFDGTTKTVNRSDAEIETFDTYEVWTTELRVFSPELLYKVHAKYEAGWSAIYAGFYLTAEKIVNEVTGVQIYDITMNSKDIVKLSTDISTTGNPTYTVKYESSNPNVASVDENGNVTAGKKGVATITCYVTDGNNNTVKDECTVTVKYTFIQVILNILTTLFGIK